MDRDVSRRGFLRDSALALGTVAVCEVDGLVITAQVVAPQHMVPVTPEERGMPHIIVKMYPGRSEQQKWQLADAIGSEDSVSVAIEEIAPADWTEKVYKPDIQKHWDKLYKKPNY